MTMMKLLLFMAVCFEFTIALQSSAEAQLSCEEDTCARLDRITVNAPIPIAVVFGATGIVGSGIVQNLLQKGETVVAPVRSKPEKLIELVGKWDGLLVPEVIDSLTSLAIIH